MTFRSAEHHQQGRIANLSCGGAFVLTRVAVPERLLARPVELSFRLDTGDAEWIAARGTILRLGNDGLAIGFDEASPQLVGALDALETASRARSRVIAVVLVDENARRRAEIARGFAAVGCTVIEASTPLEAIVRLGESRFEPDVIAIADSYDAAAADQLRAFVEREHPKAKLVTIGDEHIQPDVLVHWLSSANPDDNLAERVRDVLVAPRKRTDGA